jgi:hypothetical protein
MTTSPHHPFRSKLDFTQAESIRTRFTMGESPRSLADEFGVSLSSLYDVLSGRSHAARVTVRLKSKEFEQLTLLASDVRESCEEVAATLLRRGLSRAR